MITLYAGPLNSRTTAVMAKVLAATQMLCFIHFAAELSVQMIVCDAVKSNHKHFI